MTTRFACVWDAIEEPEHAAAMKVRANLMLAIERKVRSWKVTQREAAGRLGVTQPRLNDLLTGKITKFSLDSLVAMAARVGLTVKVVRKA